MKKIVKCYLVFDTTSGNFDVWTFKPGGTSDYVLLNTKEVEFDIDNDFDPRPLQIKALQEKQKVAAAAFHAMNNDLMRQINELQALEMTV